MSTSVQRSSTRLRELRLRAGFTQSGLARAAGIAPNSVRNAELGGVPRPELQLKIVDALNGRLDAVERVTMFDLWPLTEDAAA